MTDDLRAMAEAVRGTWHVLSDTGVAVCRKMLGEENCPEGVTVIERPPESRAEAMEWFFQAVVVGWMEEPVASYIAAACPSAVLALLSDRDKARELLAEAEDALRKERAELADARDERDRLAAERDEARAWCNKYESLSATQDKAIDSLAAEVARLKAALERIRAVEQNRTYQTCPDCDDPICPVRKKCRYESESEKLARSALETKS